MSTNYYFENKKSAEESILYNSGLDGLIEKIKNELIEYGCDEDTFADKLEDIRFLNGMMIKEIHIGKRSTGWKPLFAIQEEYHGIIGMKSWYENNKNDWDILDEYGELLTWDDLEKNLINWEGKESHIKFMENNYFHSRGYSVIEDYEWYEGEFS